MMDPLTTTPPTDGLASRVSRALRENNPFYLMSAACMLGGCLLLTNSLSWSPIRFSHLIAMLATINLYEVLLLSLGLFLLNRRGHARDGGQLLVLAAIFMADAAFLVSEVVSSSLRVGAALSAVLFALAIAKAAVALRLTRARLDPGRWGAVVATLAVLFALPVWLKWVGDTRVTGAHLYAGWWVAALLWAAWDVASRRAARPVVTTLPVAPHVLFVAIPWLSLLTHLGIMHYVYNQPFVAADSAPALLAFSLVLLRLPSPRTAGVARARALLVKLMPLAAVMVSARPTVPLAVTVAHLPSVTPWALALAGAYLVLVWSHWPRYVVHAVIGGAVGVTAYAFGPSASQVGSGASWAWSVVSGAASYVWSGMAWAANGIVSAASSSASWIWGLVPKTGTQWGVLSVSGAFVLLAIGARVSLRAPGTPAPSEEGAAR